MIRKNMNIPIYNYKLNVVELEDTGDADIVTKMLKKADMNPDFIAEIVGDLRDEAHNGAGLYATLDVNTYLLFSYR